LAVNRVFLNLKNDQCKSSTRTYRTGSKIAAA
jgi:hypothetical protein